MKGVNRHTIWPESGRSTSKAISIKDVNLIKDMNMNAVRGHYPPNEHFLGVCDSLGLFVLDELAGWQNPYDTRVGRKLVKEMVVRDVNHPSVIIWDNGNEGGWNTEIEDVFTENDPQQRIVMHPWADYNGCDTHHYPTYLTGIHRFVNGENVFFPTEFMHGTYDHGLGAGLEDFWDRFKKSPLFAGGFLWAYVDEAVKRSDWTGSEKYDSKGSLAADGILGPHREKEGSFFTIKEVWAPIQFKPLLITSTFKGRLFVTNDYLYTNLNECSVTYKVVKVSDQVFNENINKKNIDEGIFVLPSIKPGETKEVQLPVPHDFFEGDWLEIMAKDKYGREIYTWSWPIHNAAYYAQKLLPETIGNGLKTSVTQNENEITLSGGGVICKIDAKNGRVINISNENNTIPLTNGPVFIGMVAEVKNIEVYKESGNVVCKVNYNGGVDHVLWILYPDGRLHMKMNVLKNEGRNSGFDGAFFEDKIDKFGITFDYPENIVEEIKWLGNGPYRVWKNRIKGTTFGLWKKEYNNTITGESFSQLIYPEFKGYHANLIAANIKAKDQGFKVVSASEKIFLRLFTPELPKNAFPGIHLQPDFPKGDISFLYEIPAIRSFKPLEHQGPESQPSNIRIKKGDEGIYMDLWFDFRQQ